jgi:CRP-like cAMP-binding protein
MLNNYHFASLLKKIIMQADPAEPMLTLFSLLSTRVKNKIIDRANLARYQAGQLIHNRGERKPGLSIVKSGSVQVGVNGSDGTFVMVAQLGVGQCFGEFTIFTDLPRTHDISAITQTEIYQISHDDFLKLYRQEEELSAALLRVTLLRNHLLLEMLDALRRLPLLERTASVLLSMSASSGTPNHLVCRQEELAFAIGVSRVSLGKSLKRLARQNLIRIGYGEIQFPDRKALENWVSKHCNTTPLYWANKANHLT